MATRKGKDGTCSCAKRKGSICRTFGAANAAANDVSSGYAAANDVIRCTNAVCAPRLCSTNGVFLASSPRLCSTNGVFLASSPMLCSTNDVFLASRRCTKGIFEKKKSSRKRSQKEQWRQKTKSEGSGEGSDLGRSNSTSLPDEMYSHAELLAKLQDIQRENEEKHSDCIALLNKINGKLNDIKERVDVFGCELTALHNQSQTTDKALRAIHAVVTAQKSMRQEGEPQAEPSVVKEEGQDELMLSGSTQAE